MNKFYYSLPTHYKLTTKVLQTSTNLYSSTRVWLRNPEFADVTRNARNFERKDGVSDAGNRDILANIVPRNRLKQGEIQKERNPKAKPFRPQPLSRRPSKRTHFWSKRRPLLRILYDSLRTLKMT